MAYYRYLFALTLRTARGTVAACAEIGMRMEYLVGTRRKIGMASTGNRASTVGLLLLIAAVLILCGCGDHVLPFKEGARIILGTGDETPVFRVVRLHGSWMELRDEKTSVRSWWLAGSGGTTVWTILNGD